jgi:hypothetical protein
MKIAFTNDFKNVWVLSLSCALAGSIMPLMVLVGSLVGTDLAPSAAWATTPIALMILGTALAVIPVSRSMQTLGRKKALWLFMGLGIAGCGLAMISLQLQSFIMFCLTSVLLGTTNTALLQIRFIAMENVAAMFLPSFIAPLLFKYFKIRGMMILGLICYCATMQQILLGCLIPICLVVVMLIWEGLKGTQAQAIES